MINIISTCAGGSGAPDTQKVFDNLVKGLGRIGYPHVINKELSATKRLWIHDDQDALRFAAKSRARVIAGPSLFEMPDEIPPSVDLGGCLYVHSSDWARQIWSYAGFDDCQLASCPVGVDIEDFQPVRGRVKKRHVLLYHKERDRAELAQIRDVLNKMHLPYVIIEYGGYREEDFRRALDGAAFAIWHGCHERQGLALQETLACAVPVLVCDAVSVLQQVPGPFDPKLAKIPVTTAPYFDDSCGLKITHLNVLESSVEFMLANLDQFSPRQYIRTNLSLEGQARAFVNLWEHWGVSFGEGLKEERAGGRAWRAPRWYRAVKAGRHVAGRIRRGEA